MLTLGSSSRRATAYGILAGRQRDPMLAHRREPRTAATVQGSGNDRHLARLDLPTNYRQAPESASHREESDHYPAVLCLNRSWRVIRCRNDLQFILQRRKGR